MISKFATLRFSIFSHPIQLAIDAQIAGGVSVANDSFEMVPLKDDYFYVRAEADRVTCIVATRFTNPTDAVLGRVYLQELVDQRKQPSLQDAPLILYSKEAPAGIVPLKGGLQHAYISIIMFPRHYTDETRRGRSVSLVLSFRDYLHYHLKTTMAFLHTRMRRKTSLFLQKLNACKQTL